MGFVSGEALACDLHWILPDERYGRHAGPTSPPTGRGRPGGIDRESGWGTMYRVMSIARTIASLLAIEIFVPGGTLIVLTLLWTGRSNSPLASALAKRIPGLSRIVPRAT